MQLKKIKRAEKKGTESVMDEKFALLFQSKFQTGDMQLNVSFDVKMNRSHIEKDFMFKFVGLGNVIACGSHRTWKPGTTILGHHYMG